jgi:transcriptional regulator with XRE-family HTH domain
MSILQAKLQNRRKQLGIPYEDLAARSGVSVATAKRILTGHFESASFKHVAAIAETMGLSLDMREESPAFAVRQRAAEQQATRLVRMVMGTSALEAQQISEDQARTLVQESVLRLLQGSPRQVWAK